MLTCAVNAQPWDCVYQRSGRMFDSIQDALVRKEAELKGKYHCFYYAAQLAHVKKWMCRRVATYFRRKGKQQLRLIFTLTCTICVCNCVLISNDITGTITRQLIPHASAFLHLILIVAFCAHFNSIMHNKSWAFHFCSQVCYSNMGIGAAVLAAKLCHDPWISMRCKRPDQKYSLMKSMLHAVAQNEANKIENFAEIKMVRPWPASLTICRKGKKSNNTVPRGGGAASVYLRSASYCAFGSSHQRMKK